MGYFKMGDIIKDIGPDIKKSNKTITDRALWKLGVQIQSVLAVRSRDGLAFRVSVWENTVLFTRPGDRDREKNRIDRSNALRKRNAKAS